MSAREPPLLLFLSQQCLSQMQRRTAARPAQHDRAVMSTNQAMSTWPAGHCLKHSSTCRSRAVQLRGAKGKKNFTSLSVYRHQQWTSARFLPGSIGRVRWRRSPVSNATAAPLEVPSCKPQSLISRTCGPRELCKYNRCQVWHTAQSGNKIPGAPYASSPTLFGIRSVLTCRAQSNLPSMDSLLQGLLNAHMHMAATWHKIACF